MFKILIFNTELKQRKPPEGEGFDKSGCFYEKQSQYAGLKPEIRNGLNGSQKTYSSTFQRVRFEKTKPICRWLKST